MADFDFTRRAIFGAMAVAPLAISAPALATTSSSSQIDAWRAEHRRLFDLCQRSTEDADVDRLSDAMLVLEKRIVGSPAQTLADARSQLGFVIDLDAKGATMDAEDIMPMLRELARNMGAR